jgi:DNA-directed RNA polymerase subunit RPC12/RpoP
LENAQTPSHIDIGEGLAKVRSRRWILWIVILGYIPGLLIALELQTGKGLLAKLFGLWVLLLCFAVGLATVVKCPRCGKPFHTNGPTFFPVRKCVHCGLHVTADKTKQQVADRE